jgi:1,4-dihydroxy-2-naphthoyl-CoA hydrolase
MLDVADVQKLLEPLFPGLLGVRLLELSPERVLAEMMVRPDLCTAGGIMHGGAYMAFADTRGAVGTLVNLPSGKATTTTDSSTKFIAGAKVNTRVLGEVWQTDVTNSDGKLCAVVTQTQLVLEPRS